MSIDAYNPRQEFVGDGVVTTYTFDFRIRKSSHLRLVLFSDLNVKQFDIRGDDTTYIQSITFDPLLDGGEVVFKTAIANLYKLRLILDNNEPIQSSEFRDKSDFTLRLFERMGDWIVNALQSVRYRASRALVMSEETLDSANFNMELPPFPGPNQVPAINDDEDGWVWIDQSSFVGPQGPDGPAGSNGADGADGAQGAGILRAGRIALTQGSTFVSVTFSSATANANYVPAVAILTTEANAQILEPTVKNWTNTGFDVYFVAPVESGNYILSWMVMDAI